MIQALIRGGAASGQATTVRMGELARSGAYALLLGISYYLAARLGLGFRFQNSQIGVVWPSNALFVAALLLTPRRRWWIVLVVTTIAHAEVMSGVVPAWRWIWQIAGNSAFAMATAELLRRFAGLPMHFGSRRQVLAYTALAFAMPAVFGFTTPAFIQSLLGLEATYSPPAALARTLLSNSTGLLLVGPLVLTWAQHGARRLMTTPWRRWAEAVVVLSTLLAAGGLAFGTGPEIARLPWLLLWIFPPLLWAAVRFGPIGASTSLFIMAGLSMWGSARQLGPFVLVADSDLALSLQFFWLALCLPVMLLAAVIREREQAEEVLHDQRNQLAHVTRVATVGELSGALAHELRQPLASILANAETALILLDRRSTDRDELRAIVSDIAQHDRQAAGVIARLRSFMREGQTRYEPLAMENVVRDALALGRSMVEMWRVDVQAQFGTGLPHVRGDAVQLLQVMLNLVVNGCESMANVPAGSRQLQVRVMRGERDHVEVQIADSGAGLPEGREDQVFEPFFTTKDAGLGLGLAIGRSIVAAHGGRLWGENNAHVGATFHLVLPTDVDGQAPHGSSVTRLRGADVAPRLDGDGGPRLEIPHFSATARTGIGIDRTAYGP